MAFAPRTTSRCIFSYTLRDGGIDGPIVRRAEVADCINPWCGTHSEERLEDLKRRLGADLAAPGDDGILLCRR